MMSTGTIVTE